MSEAIDSWWALTNELRFVMRGGEKILQQRWEQYFRSEIGMLFDRPFEWRDVPIESNSMLLASHYAAMAEKDEQQ